MTYNFTKTDTGPTYAVQIDPVAKYGWFEHCRTGSGGGLWFDAKKRLIDYDGVFSVPKAVIKSIRALGFVVPREFE